MTTRDDSKGFYEFTKLMAEKKAAKSAGSGKSDKMAGLTFQKHLNVKIN